MAEAFLNRVAAGTAVAKSAGAEPASGINPTVVRAMAEEGIDISGAKPKGLTAEDAEWADRIITMGCFVDETCPLALVDDDWGLDDPAGQPVERVLEIRHKVRWEVEELLATLDS